MPLPPTPILAMVCGAPMGTDVSSITSRNWTRTSSASAEPLFTTSAVTCTLLPGHRVGRAEADVVILDEEVRLRRSRSPGRAGVPSSTWMSSTYQPSNELKRLSIESNQKRTWITAGVADVRRQADGPLHPLVVRAVRFEDRLPQTCPRPRKAAPVCGHRPGCSPLRSTRRTAAARPRWSSTRWAAKRACRCVCSPVSYLFVASSP